MDIQINHAIIGILGQDKGYYMYKNAFTMLELTFVIVIIGILSAIAVPKFAANRDDATIVKAKVTVSAVRNALATERQKRILRGKFSSITQLSSSTTAGAAIFDGFDGNTSTPVIEYGPSSCKTSTDQGCWVVTNHTTYTYKMPISGTAVFTLSNNRFDCPSSDSECKLLTK